MKSRLGKNNPLTDQSVFRHVFDYMMSCAPSVRVTKALFDDVQAWALKIEHGDPIEVRNESWSGIFDGIIWGGIEIGKAYRVSAAVLNVYGRFAEMTLQEWGFFQVWLPPGVALTALARVQLKPLIEVLAGPPMTVRCLPAAKEVLGLQGSAQLSCPPFEIEFVTDLFASSYFGIDTWNGAHDIPAFFKPFDRSDDEGFIAPGTGKSSLENMA